MAVLESPTPMVDLVAYQEGSVVSRKLVAEKGGNTTAFAFAEGEELSEHTTPFAALLHVIDGEARIRIGEDWHSVAAGEGMILPANRPHAVKAEQRFKMLLTMVR